MPMALDQQLVWCWLARRTPDWHTFIFIFVYKCVIFSVQYAILKITIRDFMWFYGKWVVIEAAFYCSISGTRPKRIWSCEIPFVQKIIISCRIDLKICTTDTHTKASDMELGCFLWSPPEQTVDLRHHRAYCDVIAMMCHVYDLWLLM